MAKSLSARKRAPNQDDLTAKRLKEVLHYDPETGIFRWKGRVGSDGRILADIAGKIAGSLNVWGYRQMYVDGKNRRACRLAWLYMTGKWPRTIDHINGNKADDRFANLRDVTPSQNNWNCGKHARNKSGHKGIYWKKDHGRWLVQVQAHSKQTIIGYFKTLEAAVEAQKKAYADLHGEFARLE